VKKEITTSIIAGIVGAAVFLALVLAFSEYFIN
jgi:hypothetical protein